MNKKDNLVNNILKNISKDYDIPLDELFKYYQNDSKNNIIYKNITCKARKQDGFQCTRKSKLGSIYCGKHIENRKWGCVMESDIIELVEFEYNKRTLFLDEINLIYEKNQDDKFKIIGKRTYNNIELF